MDVSLPKDMLKYIDEAIKQAVAAGIVAERLQVSGTANDAYKMTEKRLYAYEVIFDKVLDDKERLVDLQENGLSDRSKSLVRFVKSGTRLSKEEIVEAIIQDTTARIAANEYELDTIRKALRIIEKDPYYMVVYGKYIEGRTDDSIAEEIFCETSTVRRNRARLMRKLAIWFYGTEAIES